MQISLDARWLRTGIGRYIEGLLSGLKDKLEDVDLHVLTMEAYSNRVQNLCDHSSFCNCPIYSPQEQVHVPWKCRQSDLLHVPHYNVPILWNKKLVVTIHDITHLENPARYAALVYARGMLRAAVKKADAIITVSRDAKARLVDRLHAPEEKTHVIYPGVGPSFRPGSRSEARARLGREFPQGRVLLAVGNTRPHKNLPKLMQAFEIAAQSIPSDWKLVLIAGADKLMTDSQFQRDRILTKTNIADDQLRLMYQAADAFIMPSLNEGFGLPILEAMASGLPVLCSDIDVFREVAADGAQFFNPDDAASIAQVIVKSLNDPQRMRVLAASGIDRAALFNWDACAQGHAEIYRLVLQKN